MQGDVVLLAVAYGRNQRQEVKIHRPDVCYTAQGFQLVERSPTALPFRRCAVHGMRMLVKAPGRTEAVSYWIRIGDVFTENSVVHSLSHLQARAGGQGGGWRAGARVPHRAAGATAPDTRYRVQEQFLGDLVRALPPQARRLLLG